MANVKISDLTSAAAATGTQQFEVNDGFVSKKVTGAQILSYIEGEISSSPVFTGQVSLDDGTAATPSLTNTGDTNTGVFFPNADEVAISTGGTERVKVNSSGDFVINNNIELGHATDTTISRSAAGIITVEGKPVVMTTGAQTVEFAAGTVSLPSITTTGDTNTGIFFPAADTVALSTGGTERLRIGSSGQFGVAGANYGTSGQVLTSGGASAAPSWTTPSSGGMTLLGTITTTTGTSRTLTGLTLTGYQFVVLYWKGVSSSGSGIQVGVNDGTETIAVNSRDATAGSSGGNIHFTTWLNLTNGSFFSSGWTDISQAYGSGFVDTANAAGPKFGAGRTRISTATTTIDVRIVAGTAFDLGSVDVYGVK